MTIEEALKMEEALKEALDLIDDTEVPEPMLIETEEDRRLAMGLLFERWRNSLFE